MNSVAIIGAGITGLTAAFQLQRRNLPVTVYESDHRVGGVIRSVRENGYLAEFGPNTLLETSPKIRALVEDLGLSGRRLYSDPAAENRYIVRGGKPVKLPGSPIAFFGTPLFTTAAKLSLLREPFVRRSPADVEESLAQFVKRRLCQEFLDYAINPFVAGVYAGDPARLSVKQGFPKLHALEQRYGSLILGQILGARERKRRAEVSKQNAKKVSFDEGLEVLTEGMGACLGQSVRLNTPVIRIQQDPPNWIVTVRVDGREVQQEHSAVIYTGPAYRVPEIQLRTECCLDWTPLAQVYYPPVASVVLGFARSDVAHPLDGFGMLVPQIERFNILGTLFSSSLFPNRAPEGHVTLTSYIGGTRAPELALRPPDELVELTLQDLRSIVGVTGRPTFQHCFLYPKAIPQYEVGYGRFRELMSHLEASAPGLFLAGNFRDGVSLGDSILSGHAVADKVGQFFREGAAREFQPA